MAAPTSPKQGGLKWAHDAQTEQTRLDMLWEGEQDYSQPFVRYEAIAVLLLYWAKSDLNKKHFLKQEVCDIGEPCRGLVLI